MIVYVTYPPDCFVSATSIANVAFLGLGTMGSSMAANLAKNGWAVTAWNRTPHRPGVEIARRSGAALAPSIGEAVKNAEVVFTCVSDVPDVEAVILGEEGVVKFARAGTIVVDASTIGSTAAKRIGTALETQGFRFLDAPISGGDVGAKNGTLTIMVGGDGADFDRCLPLFEAIGKNIRLCGTIGSGQAVKACNQVLCAANLIGICEAMQLAKVQGIDPNLVVEVCGTGAAGSWALSNLGTKIIESNFAPGFAIKHILKDLRLVGETMPDPENNLPGTNLADRLFKITAELDGGAGGEWGTQAMIRAYRETRS